MRWFTTLTAVAVWALSVPATCLPRGDADLKDLNSKLSSKARIYLPGSSGFADVSARWSELEMPASNISVVPAIEKDVVETIKFASKYNIPFLAVNGVHGSITTLGRMDWGVSIYVGEMSGVKIAPDGKTATILGGTMSKVVTDTLWAAGKQTVTGTCECVSYLGPALGGGHGWLQGHHGLVADQFVSMNVVLADGTLKTIGPSSDLWWAMKGAGHNFGVVTSVTVKIYPLVHQNWAIETLMFTGDKVKEVYQAANDNLLKGGTQDVNVINWSYWFNLPQVDPTGPVIAFYIIQEGVGAVDSKYTKPFRDIGPFSVEPAAGTYRDLAGWVGINLDAPPCAKAGLANPRFPIYLEKYNATAQQQIYNLFAKATNASSPFAGSLFMFEGYSMQGVKAVDAASAAYAYRGDNLLIAPLLQYQPAGPVRDAQAKQLGNEIRELLRKGSGRTDLHSYVNYAYGDETAKSWYGSEAWRQTKLKALKTKYDPKGRFSFYAPVA
ncbi:FAD-dependent oxygenase [Apodospora peruviana]|uniref:FAD-dependent oxygenase n=1 Tax=Apodospora peruviana TaxID=516989 RepID=A0AAE0HXX3_9PEZI|nr:FAD-dependent oxygenase [Apodospora peruviana]